MLKQLSLRMVLVASAGVAFMVVPAQAAVIGAYDGFDYALGSLAGADGGTGWTNAWTTASATHLATTIVAPETALRYAYAAAGIDIDGGNRAAQVSAVANMADFYNAAYRAYNPSTAGGDPAADQYYSFLIQPVFGLDGSGASGDSARVLTIRSGSYMGTGVGSGSQFVLRDGDTTGFTNSGEGSNTPKLGETFLMVFRMSPTTAAGTEWNNLTIWVNPTSSVEYDGLADARGTKAATGTPNEIVFRVGNLELNDRFLIDEIRVGSSYASVVPSTHASTVVYREVFSGNGATAPTLAAMGWNAHAGTSATPSTAAAGTTTEGARTMAPVNSAQPVAGGSVGYLERTGTAADSFFYWTEEFGMNRLEDIRAVRWWQCNARTVDAFLAAVRVDVAGTPGDTSDDVWLAAASPFANHTSVATEVNSAGRLWQQNQLLLQNAQWKQLQFTPGSQMVLGSDYTLPAGAALTGLGLYAAAGEARGTHRIDNIELDTSAFQWTVAQTVLIDFNTRLSSSSPWNVIHSGNAKVWTRLLTTDGGDSGIDFRLSQDVFNANAAGWQGDMARPAWATENAAGDYVYYEGDSALAMEFVKLDPASRYDFEILASRDFASRTQSFEVFGASTRAFQFDPKAEGWDLGNWIVLSGIAPDASGRVTISMTRTDTSVCVNALRVQRLVPEPASVLLLGAALALLGGRRRRR